jgi:LemA protein
MWSATALQSPLQVNAVTSLLEWAMERMLLALASALLTPYEMATGIRRSVGREPALLDVAPITQSTIWPGHRAPTQRIVPVMTQTATLATRSIALLFTLLAALTVAGCGVNNIPTYEQQAKANWSEVLNQYKRRTDLIDNLVATVKGFAEQERTVLTDVVEARAKATQAQVNLPPDILNNPDAMKQFQDAQNTLGGALGRLMLVVERYPDIKSGQNFLALQSELSGTENRIAIARRDYIEAVRVYNTELATIPGRWWKAFMYPSSKEMATFDIAASEQTVPKVDFNKN